MKNFFRRTRETCDAVIDFCRRNVAGQTNCSAAFKAARRTLTALLIVAGVVTASLVGATVKMYTATGEGYAWEDEPQDIAKLRARDKAIKKATKEAGVYLKTYSRSVNNELTDDEVLAITSNSWQLVGEPKYTRKIINHSGDTQIIVWTATVEVKVDDAELQSWLKRDDKNKSTIITQTREAQKSSAENERKVEDLREQYNHATSQAERDKIRQQMNQADRDFLANQKLRDGLKLYYAKNFNGAIQLYNEVIELKPDWSWPYNNRGVAYYELKQYERAIQDYNKAIQLNPNFAMAYNNRGVAYNDLKQYERAIQDFDKAIQLNPNYANAYCGRGVAYKNLKQYDRAIADYTKAIQLDPNNAGAYNNRGNAYNDLKQYERAIQDYTKAIQLNPNYAGTYSNRGVAYGELKQYEQAIQDFNKAIQIDPNNAAAYNNRGIAYYNLKQYERAIQDYDKAIQLNPNYAEAYNNRGEVYFELKQYERTIRDYNKALTFLEHPAMYCNRGEAYYYLKNYNQAFADLNKAIQLGVDGKDLGEVLYYRGLCYQATGDNAKAQADFAKAKQLGFSG